MLTLLDDLPRRAAGVKVELAPGASAFIGRKFSGISLYQIEVEFSNLPVDPRLALRDPAFLELVLKGSLRAPVLSQSKVRRLLDLPAYGYRGTNLDEQVEVRLVEPK